MTQTDTLYGFLTAKLKERGIPVESLPQLLGVSRSTLYRNMKGIVQMSAEVRIRFGDLLELDASDRQKYDRLSGLVAFDSSLVEARQVLDQFIFPGRPQPVAKSDPIRFVLYENDTYLRTSDQIYDRIRAMAETDGASAEVRILNCTDDPLFSSISGFLQDLLTSNETVTVEHLVTLSQCDYTALIATVTRLLPLLKFNRYATRYAQVAATSSRAPGVSDILMTKPCVFSNAMSVEIRIGRRSTFFLLSFFEGDLSTCLVTTDRNVIDFLYSNYNADKESYSAALIDSTNISFFSDTVADLQENTGVSLFKPNFCFDRIPVSVFESMLAKAAPDELARIQKAIASPEGDPAASLETVINTLERRERASHLNHHIDVCSMAGLSELAETGRISDHLDVLPSFDPSERRAIFSYVQARLNDPLDPYTLYVTRDDFFQNGYIIMAMEDLGVLITNNTENCRRGLCDNLFIANAALAEVFTDYATNHISQAHALSLEETNAFLTGLIESIE